MEDNIQVKPRYIDPDAKMQSVTQVPVIPQSTNQQASALQQPDVIALGFLWENKITIALVIIVIICIAFAVYYLWYMEPTDKPTDKSDKSTDKSTDKSKENTQESSGDSDSSVSVKSTPSTQSTPTIQGEMSQQYLAIMQQNQDQQLQTQNQFRIMQQQLNHLARFMQDNLTPTHSNESTQQVSSQPTQIHTNQPSLLAPTQVSLQPTQGSINSTIPPSFINNSLPTVPQPQPQPPISGKGMMMNILTQLKSPNNWTTSKDESVLSNFTTKQTQSVELTPQQPQRSVNFSTSGSSQPTQGSSQPTQGSSQPTEIQTNNPSQNYSFTPPQYNENQLEAVIMDMDNTTYDDTVIDVTDDIDKLNDEIQEIISSSCVYILPSGTKCRNKSSVNNLCHVHKNKK
jgi:hypothetical protein